MILCLIDIRHAAGSDFFQYLVSVSDYHSYLNHIYLFNSSFFRERIHDYDCNIILAAIVVSCFHQLLCPLFD